MAVALVSPPNPVEFLKGVKSFAPDVGKIKLPNNIGISLAALAQFSGSAIRKRISHSLKRKTKRKKGDNTRLVKIADAIDCVEESLRDPEKIRVLAESVVSTILAVGRGIIQPNPDDYLGFMSEEICDCIRSKRLPQTSSRTTHRETKYGRPARGHGRGRHF